MGVVGGQRKKSTQMKVGVKSRKSAVGLNSSVAFLTGHGFLGAELMPNFTANSDYEEKDSDPIRLQPGDEIHAGAADRTWPGWVWATDAKGNDGYVPEKILKSLGDGKFQALDAFDPTVLTIRRGDHLESLRQIDGWHWCRNESGTEGWVAGYLLRPV